MKLFEPIEINGMQLRNRIIMPAMQLMLGLKNRRAQAFYQARAKGGVGAIIMCATSVDLLTEDKPWRRPDGVAQFVAAMQTFTADIRADGAKIGIQLWHGNQLPAGDGSLDIPESDNVAPSAVGDRRALTIAEIETIIEKFGRATRTAQKAGFDFIEVHGAHGYLPCQFFSPADNRRTDRYGGDLDGRMRFGIQIVAAIREAVGTNFPVFYRIGAWEERSGGITLDQSKIFAANLEKAGIDAIDVSIGFSEDHSASPSKKAKMGTFVDMAAAIKESVSIPVMAVGRINLPDVAEEILNQNRADIIGIARQLVTDPQWPNKVKQGKADTIVACKSCNACFNPMQGEKWKFGDPVCAVNRMAGCEVDGN